MSEFYKEVSEQPHALDVMLQTYAAENFESIKKAATLILQAKTALFTGMGTSFYAPQTVIGQLSSAITPIIIETGELIDSADALLDRVKTFILISQSGESVEIKKLIPLLPSGAQVIGITNDTSSTLAKASTILLPLYAGKESSITNKTFTNTLALLFLLAQLVEQKPLESVYAELKAAVSLMQDVLSNGHEQIKNAADLLAPAGILHFIGRGSASMVLANQSALIYMEGAKCFSRSFTSGSFRHGPIETCGEATRAVFYACDLKTFEKMKGLAAEIQKYGGHVVFITNRECGLPFEIVFPLNEMQFVLCAAVVMELLLIETARQKGLTAGVFSITNKICSSD